MWFDVDKEGLSKLVERRGKAHILFELLQNAWDQQQSTRVDVTLEPVPGSRRAVLRVEDDCPEGFRDLSHAWTLYAESGKKGDPSKRGRFNLGEKIVLSLCDEATILSTSGGVRFDASGRHRLRQRRERGTLFQATIRMTRSEIEEVVTEAARLIPPEGKTTTVNGKVLGSPTRIGNFSASLQTEVSDAEGFLRRVHRKTTVCAYRPTEGEAGWLYEMGIPVVETGDAWHLDVGQKVPLGMERDGVPPAFLRSLRMQSLNALHAVLPEEHAAAPWVRDAMTDPNMAPEAVRAVIRARFGDKAVSYDPSDAEGTKIAVSHGYTVVHGGEMTRAEWENVRKSGALLPAGQVTPSPKPYSPDGDPLNVVPPDEWTRDERAFAAAAVRIAKVLIGRAITVVIADQPGWSVRATFGPQSPLVLNRRNLGAGFFGSLGQEQLSLLLHEFGHDRCLDHLSRDYYRALTDLGAKLAMAAAADPSLISLAPGQERDNLSA
jgi:hypothetical protein